MFLMSTPASTPASTSAGQTGSPRSLAGASSKSGASAKLSFWQAGHPPTLLAAFLYFDLAFMVWVMLGPLGVQIAKDLALSPSQKGLMVATPVLAGALLRIT
jgi:NNP family nitrate/nitrite transporter-like MFS transporter